MTPLLQQAIQLLQLSTLELEQVVRKELEENPLLEEVAEETQDVDAEAQPAAEAGRPSSRRPRPPPSRCPRRRARWTASGPTSCPST